MHSILQFRPLLRSYYFGGQRLSSWNKKLSSLGAAESWEVSAYPEFSSIVNDGEFAGHSLAELFPSHPDWWPTESLPLVKLLDVSSPLPIHVHPSDLQAQQMPGKDPGKMEAWVVLQAGSESDVAIGFNRDYTADEVLRATLNGELSKLLNHYSAEVGDIFLVPARTPHSAHDVVIWEVQQPSDRSVFAEPHDIYGETVSQSTFETWANDFTMIVSLKSSAGHRLSSIWEPRPSFSGFGCPHFLVSGLTANQQAIRLSYGILTGIAERALVKLSGTTTVEVGPGTSVLLPMGIHNYSVIPLSSGTRLLHVRHPSRKDLDTLGNRGFK